MTKEQAQDLIRQIPFIQEDLCTERNPTNLRVHYEASLQSHQCKTLVSLIKGIRHKCRETERKGRKMGQVDQRYRKKAEGLLHGELSIALGIPLARWKGISNRICRKRWAEKGSPQGPVARCSGTFFCCLVCPIWAFWVPFDDPPFAVGGDHHQKNVLLLEALLFQAPLHPGFVFAAQFQGALGELPRR